MVYSVEEGIDPEPLPAVVQRLEALRAEEKINEVMETVYSALQTVPIAHVDAEYTHLQDNVIGSWMSLSESLRNLTTLLQERVQNPDALVPDFPQLPPLSE